MLKNPSFIFSWNRKWTKLSRIQNQSAAVSLVLVTHLSLGAGDATGVEADLLGIDVSSICDLCNMDHAM